MLSLDICYAASAVRNDTLDVEPELEAVHDFESNVHVDDTEDNNYVHCETPKKRLNISLQNMDISPIVLHSVVQHSCVSCAKRKLEKAI